LALRDRGSEYLKKFGMKFLISAKGKTGKEMLAVLNERINNTEAQELDNARKALWEITKKRFDHQDELTALKNEYGIKDCQLSFSTTEFSSQSVCLGNAKPHTYFEIASLSKSIASAFAIEYLSAQGIDLETPVNVALSKTKSDFRLKGEWGDQVTIANLMSHNALNMHYVNGVPCARKMPNVTEFLNGNAEYGYPEVEVINKPDTVFNYSGGGFLVLEHLIEALSGKSAIEMTAPFLKQLGMDHLSFDQHEHAGIDYAHAIDEKGQPLKTKRLMFPSFAAGAMGNAASMHQFLHHMTRAYHDINGSGPISHDTATQMLFGRDQGS